MAAVCYWALSPTDIHKYPEKGIIVCAQNEHLVSYEEKSKLKKVVTE